MWLVVTTTQSHIKPASHDFRRFLRKFWTDFREILQKSFLIQILTTVKNSQNYIEYLKG